MGKKVSKKDRENILNVPASQGRGKKGKAGSAMVAGQTNKDRLAKPQKVEPLVKEEGEMSDNEEVYEKLKEEKWMEWCEDVMVDQTKTLGRLQRLQTISADLPKEKVYFYMFVHSRPCSYVFPPTWCSKMILLNVLFLLIHPQVLSKIRNYLQLLGRKIDQIVIEHEEEPYRQDSTFFLWLIYISRS